MKRQRKVVNKVKQEVAQDDRGILRNRFDETIYIRKKRSVLFVGSMYYKR
jgi:hypothetical protein